MKPVFLLFLLAISSFAYGMDGGEDLNSESLYRRAKKQIRRIDLKNLDSLTPFAIVATCYLKEPKLTLAALGLTLIVIILKDSYVQKKIKQCVQRLSKVIPFAINRDHNRLCVPEK